jgi:dihydrofolate synthase / folylpolyglutamate synthase
MNVKSIKTHKITTKDTDILSVLDKYIKNLKEGSVIVVASKIVAITQGRVLRLTPEEKEELIKKEADFYIPKVQHAFNLYITIKNNYLTYSSGMDESNVEEGVVLWPENPQKVANEIRAYFKKKFQLKKLGIIITDMSAIPLKWGLIAAWIAYSGFEPVNNQTGQPDIFGRNFNYTWEGIATGLAVAAGVVMGEGSQQTPIGVIEDVPFVKFVSHDPSKEELEKQIVKPENDLFGPMLTAAKWEKGGNS